MGKALRKDCENYFFLSVETRTGQLPRREKFMREPTSITSFLIPTRWEWEREIRGWNGFTHFSSFFPSSSSFLLQDPHHHHPHYRHRKWNKGSWLQLLKYSTWRQKFAFAPTLSTTLFFIMPDISLLDIRDDDPKMNRRVGPSFQASLQAGRDNPLFFFLRLPPLNFSSSSL